MDFPSRFWFTKLFKFFFTDTWVDHIGLFSVVADKGCKLEEQLGEDQGKNPTSHQAVGLAEQLGDLYCKVGCYSKSLDAYRTQVSYTSKSYIPEHSVALETFGLLLVVNDSVLMMQLKGAEAQGKGARELAVIHVSLAATYTDLRQYSQAVEHYRQELELRKGNFAEVKKKKVSSLRG